MPAVLHSKLSLAKQKAQFAQDAVKANLPFYSLLETGIPDAMFHDSSTARELVRGSSIPVAPEKFAAFVNKCQALGGDVAGARDRKELLGARDYLGTFDPKLITRDVKVISSDIGGTNLRVSSAVVHKGDARKSHAKSKNFNITELCKDLPKDREFESFIELLADKYAAAGLTSGDALAVTWSFPFKAIPRTGSDVPGVGAEIYGLENQQKDVPFLKRSMSSKLNGVRIDEVLLAKLKERHNIVPASIVFLNDTSAAAMAEEHLDGAVILSTGANSTCIEKIQTEGKTTYTRCNAESGAFITANEVLSGVEAFFAELKTRHDGLGVSFEGLVSGRFLGTSLAENLRAHIGAVPWMSDKKTLQWFLSNNALADSKLLTALDSRSLEEVKDVCLETGRLIDQPLVEDSFNRRMLFMCYARQILERGGSLGAVMAQFSIYPLLEVKDSVRVGIDSSLAENSPTYKSALQATFAQLTEGKGELVFLARQGKFSPPQIGAMNAAAMIACSDS